VPVYDGPADPGAGRYRDLRNLPEWSNYDRFTAVSYERARNDFNAARHVAASVSDRSAIEKAWREDNRYCSSAFVAPKPVFSLEELHAGAGGKPKLDDYLAFCRGAPMVVSVAPGIEEVFGLFQASSRKQLSGLAQVVEHLRSATGKPVMVGHGGYWNRLELEKVPFFDIYDPETEPFYPASLHTDLMPLVAGRPKAVWLRPQMYEDVPYERWRFHAYVELMRGARGWQFAHGPGDASLFRGLRGELEFLKPIAYSKDPGPKVSAEPQVEHWSRRHGGKTYVIAATTRGLAFGSWRAEGEARPASGRGRLTESASAVRDEANAYGIGEEAEEWPGVAVHGIQYLPDARAWPSGSRLAQWVRLHPRAAARGLMILVKADGRWTRAASWGRFDASPLRRDVDLAHWFLRTFYRHAPGFLGWDRKLVASALDYVPARSVAMGPLPRPGEWTRLELPLDLIEATGALLDGVGFMHEGGRVSWGRSTLIGPGGRESVAWGDSLELPSQRLARTRISVEGLRAGTRVRVLFEDRELIAEEGGFSDDFRGADLYQRFGGGWGVGYGDAPVALHAYEIPP
jgi:hypothetical protein